MLHTDFARFAADDVEPLVSASFACPWCLSLPTEVVLNLEPEGSMALCRCEECRRGWALALDSGQSLRVALAPPPGIELAQL